MDVGEVAVGDLESAETLEVLGMRLGQDLPHRERRSLVLLSAGAVGGAQEELADAVVGLGP